MNQHFHFTLGPVQGFVAQARRTRDFWAGSFILSWLVGVAMKAVEKQRGDIVFPKPDQAFMEAIENGGKGPKQGTIPNRFMAKVDDDFKPEYVVTAVQAAWKELADQVWNNDLKEICEGKQEVIWNRQIPAFWDIKWALLENDNAPGILDYLKNWRTHLPTDEPGVKCMMMDGWQELSGNVQPGEGPKEFWRVVRSQKKTGIATDLRPNEMLCAIAFVKRRFVRCFGNVTAAMPGGWCAKGWELPHSVPSVHYMAVAPWLAQLIGCAKSDESIRKALWGFHDAAYSLTGNYGEWGSNIKCIHDAVDSGAQKKWEALDGTVFFDAMLENANLWGEKNEEAKAVLSKLKALRNAADLAPVSPFYAVLMMDGDSLGEQMGDTNKRPFIAEGLARFTSEVEKTVYEHNGFLIYAGGDDVLALLPLEDALNCAAALRKHYLACFATTTISTSISAAIEYAHVKMPLGKVLRDVHELLDDVAKDGRGRDAVACRVWKPGGKAVEWAQPWEIALRDCSVIIELLAEDFRKNQNEDEEAGRFAGKFFYRIGERFELLNPVGDENEKLLKPILEDDQAVSLMAMEYLNSGTTTARTMDEARKMVGPLLAQCRPNIRERKGGKISFKPQPVLNADGALLVRFLAQKGVER